MAGSFSPTAFFRKVPNKYLAEFFQTRHQVLLDISFSELKENQIKPIFEAFKELPEEISGPIGVECMEIDKMACARGIEALVEEASQHGDEEFRNYTATLENFHAQALWAYINHHPYWKEATYYYRADKVAPSQWHKRNDFPKIEPNTDPEATSSLAQFIGNFFFETQARGRHCKVEVFNRAEKTLFFVYPEDYAQSEIVWEGNDLSILSKRPAFEVIYLYSKAEGALDVYAPKNTGHLAKLQSFFAASILQIEDLPKIGKNKIVYDLDPLGIRGFDFTYPLASGIEKAVVIRLRIALKRNTTERIIFEADASVNEKAVYDLLEMLKPSSFFVTQAEIEVTFRETPTTPKETKKFRITHPNHCNLTHEGQDARIREMLKLAGIEPEAQKFSMDDLVP